MARLLHLIACSVVIEFGLLAHATNTIHSNHVVACLDGPVHTDELPLEAYVHDIHVYIYGVFAVWIACLVSMTCVLVRVLSHQNICLVLWVDKILFLAIHLQLGLIPSSVAEIACFLLLHFLLGSPAFVGASTVLGESMAVPHSIALSL